VIDRLFGALLALSMSGNTIRKRRKKQLKANQGKATCASNDAMDHPYSSAFARMWYKTDAQCFGGLEF
jgi:hypothetical protein